MFEKVTHIQLAEPLRDDGLTLDLTHWPNLSHIAVPVRPWDCEENTLIEDIWKTDSIIKLVLVVYTDDMTEEELGQTMDEIRAWFKEEGEKQDDEKQSQYVLCERKNLQRDWELEQRGGATIWERACRM